MTLQTLSEASHPCAGSRAPSPSMLPPIRDWSKQLLARERRLAFFGAILLASLVPLALAWGWDTRELRGANVWLKPMKFAASIAILALTTAWFAGHLPPANRAGRAMNWIVWLLIGSGSFEMTYISVQAGLGQGSHYNIGDAFHAAMYALMGLGAIVLTATQPMLAWQLYRHADPARPAAYRQAILIGLVLTFVLGAGVGGILSGRQPPTDGQTLPMVGWVLGGGDLRPAHFIGIHAQQLLPLFGFSVTALGLRHPRTWVWTAAVAYVALFTALLAWGLAGRP
jgi:hypothetical protein